MASAKIKPARLITLCHHRWALPVLAELHRTGGARFVSLSRGLGVNRDSLRRTLAALIGQGWVRRNPGYGHPLRPEYVLTRAGTRLAPWCRRVLDVLRALKIDQAGLRKWSLPVLVGLGQGRERFNDLVSYLPDLTPRSLALALKDLQGARLVERRILRAYPPATWYRLSPRARKLQFPLTGLGSVLAR